MGWPIIAVPSVYVLRSQGRAGPTLRIPILRSAKAAPVK